MHFGQLLNWSVWLLTHVWVIYTSIFQCISLNLLSHVVCILYRGVWRVALVSPGQVWGATQCPASSTVWISRANYASVYEKGWQEPSSIKVWYGDAPTGLRRCRVIIAQEVGLRCKNFAVEFKVEARRAGPRTASLLSFGLIQHGIELRVEMRAFSLDSRLKF
jgi:hypothetical protein